MKKIGIVFLFLLSLDVLEGQDIIRQISFNGADHIDHKYLDRITNSEKGGLYSSVTAEEDIQVLNRLSGVLQSSYRIDTIENGLHLIYEIKKRGTILPIVGLGGNTNNFWWNLGFSEYNLNNKNQKLEVYYLNNDRRHNGKLFFQNDRIKGSDWGYNIDLNRLATLEPLFFDNDVVDFDYKNHAAGVSLIKWIANRYKANFGATFFREDYYKISTISETPGPDQLGQKKILLKFLFEKNRILYDYFYKSGYSWSVNFQNVNTLGEDGSFNSLTFVGKQYYRPTRKINLAFRLRAAVATNSDSPFAPFVLDSNFNIRGIGNRVDRGTAQVVLNSEFRYAIRHRDIWAFQAVFFIDAGSWRAPGGQLNDIWNLRDVIVYSGLGVRIIYQKQVETSIRIDYGFDIIDKSRSGLVIGIGQYF